MPVTVGKRTTCKPLAKAFPKPRAVDLRLADLKQSLKFDPAKTVHGKKRKRARTLQSGFGAACKRAQKKLLGLLPKALAFIDRKGGGARSSRIVSGPALASGGCGPGPAGPIGHSGGASIGTLGDNGGYIDAPAGGGLRVRVTFYSCGGVKNFRIPECPTANGDVDAKVSGEFRATTEVWDGGHLVSRSSSTFEEKAKVHGEVGADAKLKFIEVEHTQEVSIVASGGIVIRGGVTRKARIDMPAGRYDPAHASVRFFGHRIPANSGADAFAGTADAAIKGYRGAEPRWSSFNPSGPYCAEASFSLESNALKLKKGDSGQLGIFAKARQGGGRASAARWTLLNQENAEFSPSSSQNPAPSIAYSVTNAPQGGQVRVTAKFTSTAGVGEKAWTQPVEQGSLPPAFNGSLSGTAVYDAGELGPGNGLSANYSGSISLSKAPTPSGFPESPATYTIQGGSIQYNYSGHLSSAGCDVSGSGTIDLGAQLDLKGAGALTLFDEQPRKYQYLVPMPALEMVVGTKSGCEEPNDDGGPFPWPVATGAALLVRALLPGGPVADDWNISGSGSGSNGGGSPDQTWQWGLVPSH